MTAITFGSPAAIAIATSARRKAADLCACGALLDDDGDCANCIAIVRQNSPEAVGAFSAAMEANGWTLRRDINGVPLEWIYACTGKVVVYRKALEFYWMTGNTPAKLV